MSGDGVYVSIPRKPDGSSDPTMMHIEGGTLFTNTILPSTDVSTSGTFDIGSAFSKYRNLNGFDIADLAVSKGTSGYTRLFDNIIIQWVRTTSTEVDGKHSGSWPTSFTTIYGAVISKGNNSSVDIDDNNTANISYTTTNWYVNFNENGTRTTFIIAIGTKD